MLPLLLALSLWGPSSPSPRAALNLLPPLRTPFAALDAAPPVVAPSASVPLTFALAEGGVGAGALVLSEGLFGLVGFGVLEDLNFPGRFSAITSSQLPVVVAMSVVGLLGLPAMTAVGAYLTGTLNGDSRAGRLSYAILGALVGTAAAVGVGLLYGLAQNSLNLSGASETVPALAALAFQLVAIPVGATIGLHWDSEPVAMPVAPAPPPSTPPSELPPPSMPLESPSAPPPIAVPKWTAHVTVLSIPFG